MKTFAKGKLKYLSVTNTDSYYFKPFWNFEETALISLHTYRGS